MTDIDGATLDALTLELLDTGPDDARTAAELARRTGIDDRGGSPVTREAIRELIDERGVPVVAGTKGYYLLDSPAELKRYLATLDSRIAGIEERKQLVVAAWNRYRDAQAETGERRPAEA